MNIVALLVLPSVIMVSLFHTVHSLSDEAAAGQYIVQRLLPTHPLLALKVLRVITHNLPSMKRNHYGREEQIGSSSGRRKVAADLTKQQEDDANSLVGIESAILNNEADDVVDDVDDENVVVDVGEDVRRGGEVMRKFQSRKRSLLRAIVRPIRKRTLGRCIHNCLNGRGGMTFIQCKSMCH